MTGRAELEALARRQDGVVTTAQGLARGVVPDWLERQVRAGHWQRLHRGVLVTHSGPVPWRARARAALLYSGPGAVLSHGSAAFLHGFGAMPAVLDVSVRRPRQVTGSPGLRVHRRTALDAVLENRFPVTSAGTTVLDLLERVRNEDDAVGLLCEAVRAGVWAQEILDAADGRTRVRQRSVLLAMLSGVQAGAESPLEHRYHRDVERRHGLPRSVRQRYELIDGRWIRADVLYDGFGVRVELDGALAHPGGRTDADTWRDNAVLLQHGDLTLRYRWRHVALTACATAAQVAAALTGRGWRGTLRSCGPHCTALAA